MAVPSPHRIRELFDAAMALPGPRRLPFLDAECAADPALHEAVARLLQADLNRAGFLATASLSHQGDPLAEASGLPPGERIGPYEIESELGRGGSGVVYLARQHQPVDRQVALKILSATPDSVHAAQRFRSEQRTLARMEHDHIARLHDAGVDPLGRLWFAMELVRGAPVTRYCDLHRLPLPARLRLFAAICRAVHHAHLRGVIHRDLKPSNLLVTETNGQPVPKIIDFGIARALETETDPSLTLTGGLIGTPAYMSPEQFGDGTGEIDARTDLYSLGLVLFELLAGLPARDLPSSGSAALHAARSILQESPDSPAARFTALPPDRQAAAARDRQTDPPALRRFLQGDAGRIISRCLHRQPSDRFPSAESLATDLENLLAHRPLTFAKPGWLYPAAKFLRRHRTAALIAAAAGLTAITSLSLGLHAHLARRDAESRALAESTRAAAETARAAREGRKGYLITEAMTSLFRSASPDTGQSPDRTVRNVVESWTRQLPASVREDPEVEALARLSLGNAWKGFGNNPEARRQYTAAAALLETPSPAFVPARALVELNLAHFDLQEKHTARAETRLLLARQYFTSAGPSSARDLLRAELLLAGQRTDSAQPAAAASIARRILTEARNSFPADFELQARAHWQLARAARSSGDSPAWESHVRQRLALLLQVPDLSPAVLLEARFDALQADYLAAENRPQALTRLEDLLTEYARLTGPAYPYHLALRADLARLLATTGDPASARRHYQSLLHDAPHSPARPQWQEALDALPATTPPPSPAPR